MFEGYSEGYRRMLVIKAFDLNETLDQMKHLY